MKIKTFGSWFVIIVMVASTIGFAIYFTERGDEGSSSSPNNNEPSQPNLVSVSAQDIDARVVEVLSRIVLSAGTDEAEKEVIDALLFKANGIEEVNSRYSQNSQNYGIRGSLLYIAEISFNNSSTNAEKIFNEINDNTKGVLLDASAYEMALISVPEKIEFVNSDMNLAQNYSFNDLVLSYVGLDALKEDQLKVSIEADFDGKSILNPVSFMTSNITGATKSLSGQLELPVKSLFDNVSFYADLNYSFYEKYSDANALKQELSSFSGILGSNIEVLPAERAFSLSIDDNSFFLKSQDFNSMLSADTGIKGFSFYSGEKFAVQINFVEGAKIDEVKDSISLMLADLNVVKSKYSFIESRAAVSGDLNISVDASQFKNSFSEFLFSNYFNPDSFNLKQKASFEAASFYDADSNSSFVYDQNSFFGLIDAGRKQGDLVKLLVYYEGYRGKALNVRAIEAPKEEVLTVP
ncbi:MAG: hypothetical protein AB1467_04385 [Candidatus Diapherotrites archaeon]